MMLIDLSVLLNNAYSYWGLFILVFLSSAIIVPEIELITASFATFVTDFHGLVYLVLLVIAASVLGDLSVYFLARKFSAQIEAWMRGFKWYSKNEGRYRIMLNNYGFQAVFITRIIIPGAGLVLNYICGFEKMDRKKFITAVILGETLAALLPILIGYIFKDTWTELLNLIQTSILTLSAFIIIVFLIYYLIKYYKNDNRQ